MTDQTPEEDPMPPTDPTAALRAVEDAERLITHSGLYLSESNRDRIQEKLRAIRAALASQADDRPLEREGLDIERLARAIWEAETNESAIYRDRPFEDISDSAKVERRAHAAAIAREYVALRGGPDATD